MTRPLDPGQEGDVLVRALYSAVSRGTESLVFRGEVPSSQHNVMRAPFQDGDFPAPVKYGYSSVGQVAGGPPELLGRIGFCLYPHQDLYHVPRNAWHELPSGVPPERAVLAANLETAVNAVWDAKPGPGDRVVVIGGGVVGLLISWLTAQIPGTDVVVVDVDPGKSKAARQLGLSLTSQVPTAGDADLVVHATGNPDALASGLEAAGPEATVVEVSWFGDRPVTLPLGEAFHSRRLTLRSSQVGRLPPERAPRWSHARRMGLALELLRASELDVLITGESSFDELPRLMAELSQDPAGVLCHRIRYDQP